MSLALKYDPIGRMFQITPDHDQAIREFVTAAVAERDHYVVGYNLIGPIRTRAVYNSWTGSFFANAPMSKGDDPPVVAKEDYVGIAFKVAPDRTQTYVRPGYLFVESTNFFTQAGVEIGLDDAARAGWNVLDSAVTQVAEELARKRDTEAQTLVDAAIPATREFTSPSLTKSLFDHIVRTSEENQFPVNRVIMSASRARDMTDWETSLTWMWGNLPESYGEQIMRMGYLSNYLGITLEIQPNIPSTAAYFVGSPAERGRFWFNPGGTRVLSDQDIHSRMTMYAYDEEHHTLLADASDMWKVTFA